MQIESINGRELTLEECRNIEGWDRTFEHAGYPYIIVEKGGKSRHTQVDYPGNMMLCFNLHHHTLCGIPITQTVKPLESKLQIRKIT